jgi:hypothetical protein
VRGVLESHARLYELLEVVMDLGRPPMARFPGHDEALSEVLVTQEDLDYATQQVRVRVHVVISSRCDLPLNCGDTGGHGLCHTAGKRFMFCMW